MPVWGREQAWGCQCFGVKSDFFVKFEEVDCCYSLAWPVGHASGRVGGIGLRSDRFGYTSDIGCFEDHPEGIV